MKKRIHHALGCGVISRMQMFMNAPAAFTQPRKVGLVNANCSIFSGD